MGKYMEYDYAKSMVTQYFKDPTTGVPITKLTKETQTVNSLKNIIQLIGEPDRLVGITFIDESDMVEIENYSDLTTANQYYVDYPNSIIYFHSSQQAKEFQIEYGSKGLTLIGYGRVFSKLDANGNVLETLQDILGNEDDRKATFIADELDRAGKFITSEAGRTNIFSIGETSRSNAFNTSEAFRVNAFASNELARQSVITQLEDWWNTSNLTGKLPVFIDGGDFGDVAGISYNGGDF